MNSTCDSLYTADWLITQNEGRDIIHEAALAVAGDRILCVGHAEMLQILYPEARRVDLGEAVILPGLINAHTHVSMSLLRGYSAKGHLSPGGSTHPGTRGAWRPFEHG